MPVYWYILKIERVIFIPNLVWGNDFVIVFSPKIMRILKFKMAAKSFALNVVAGYCLASGDTE